MTLNVGVLIIGSLLWDSKKERRAWRKDRLSMESSRAVTVPIRYGRRSTSRGNTYTMVLSRSCYQAVCGTGHAKVVSCSRGVSSPQDLFSEAECLWRAEKPDADSGRISATWGCVALLCNPKRRIPDDLLKAWATRVAQKPDKEDYQRLIKALDEGGLISEGGLLRIDWPRLVEDGTDVDLDLLLATPTKPTLAGMPLSYPSTQTISAAWLVAGEHLSYFQNNRDYGISTFQDEEICALLHQGGQGVRMTLEEIVRDYIRIHRNGARDEMRDFEDEPSLRAAVRRAALCEWPDGTRHPHQRRIPKPLLKQAEARLQAVSRQLAKAADFTVLHRLIEEEIGGIRGIGALTVYDIAHRIGAYLRKTPERVYMHAGTRTGARALNITGDSFDPKILPKPFARLSPAEIEDCLCIYKDQLRGERSRRRRNSACNVVIRSRNC